MGGTRGRHRTPGRRAAPWIGLIVAAVVAAAAGWFATAAPAQAATISGRITNGYGRCLENLNNSTATNNKAQIDACSSAAAQQWNRQVDGTIRTPAGRCLEVYNGGTASNTAVVTNACTSSTSQQWTATNGALVNKRSAKCLQFYGANTNGSWAVIATCNRSTQQRWTVPAMSTPVMAPPTTATPPRTTTSTTVPSTTSTTPRAPTTAPTVLPTTVLPTTVLPTTTTAPSSSVATTTSPTPTSTPPTSPTLPPVTVPPVQLPTPWAADLSKSDVVAAGFKDNSYNRELGDGVFNNPSLPWPIKIGPAPAGRAGNAVPFSLPDNAIRLEVEPNHKTFTEGDDAYFGFAFYLASDFPLATQSWNVIEQLHAAPNTGSPPVSFQAAKGGLLLDGGWGKPGVADPLTYAYQRRLMDLVPQRWYNVVYHVHFSASAENSVVDAWVDGTQVLAGFHPPGGTVYAATPTDDRVGTYRKEGFYHSASIPGGTLYMAGQRYGGSYAAVDPSQPAATSPLSGLLN